MGKMSELSAMLDELIDTGRKLSECGDRLTKVASGIREAFSETVAPVTNMAQPKKQVQKKEPERTYTKEDVRKLLAEKSVAGFREQAKALVKKYGGGSLTDVNPSQYPDLVKEAEALGE